MKKLIIIALGFLVAAPIATYAATYHFVDLQGNVQDIEAATPAEALAQAQIRQDDPHSGVIIENNMLDTGDKFANVYQYTTISGTIKTVQSATLDGALIQATDRDPASGFTIVGTIVETS